jgi:hypothetical protein
MGKLVIAALLLLGVAAFCYRPATLIGVHGDALAHSIGGGSLVGESRCSDAGDGDWRCVISDDQGSGVARYRVGTRSFGCWDAVRQGPGGEGGTPKRASGCLDLFDVLRL